MGTIRIKRIYDSKKSDGSYRILVDRLWPRGIKKADLEFDEWNKEIAPSTELRKQFNHKPELFEEFTEKYLEELKDPDKAEELERIRKISENQSVTLLFGARDTEKNHAAVLQKLLKESEKMKKF